VGTTFAASTAYTATITLTPATGFTVTGVPVNFFTVAGILAGTVATNLADSGVITAYFTTTAAAGTAVISTIAIPGVTRPVTGATPVTTTTTNAQYTGTVTWKTLAGVVPTTFAAGTVYVATITLTPAAGYTLTGVLVNSFTVATATATNPADSGVVTAVFPATFTAPKVVSCKFSDSDTITIVYSQAVVSLTGSVTTDYTAAAVTYPIASALTLIRTYGSGTDTISIDFSGDIANGLTEGKITINATVTGIAAEGLLPIVKVTDQVIAAGAF